VGEKEVEGYAVGRIKGAGNDMEVMKGEGYRVGGIEGEGYSESGM
jgi:hypothetical protein